MRFQNDDDEQKLLDAANPHLRALITAMLDTASRSGELQSLQWRDVNLKRKEMTIRAEKSKTRTGCTPVDVSTPPPDGFVTVKAPSVCQDRDSNVTDNDVSNGGYILLDPTVQDTIVHRDSAAHVTGYCDIMGWSYAPPPAFCKHFDPQYVHLMGIDFWVYPPTELTSHSFAFAPSGVDHWDTHPISGKEDRPDEIGTFRYQFISQSFATNCSPSVKSNPTEKSIQVIPGCLPKFHTTAGAVRMPIDQNIRVVLPHPDDPNDPITSAFWNAVNVWTADLRQYNVQLPTFQVNGTNQCAIPLDHGHCVQVNAPVGGMPACAQTYLHPGPDGTLDEPAVISINGDYTNWTTEILQETFLHEFGHMFDLDNHLDSNLCPTPGSVMNAPEHNQGCGDMTGRTATPQASDVAAVANSTYGTSQRKMCAGPLK